MSSTAGGKIKLVSFALIFLANIWDVFAQVWGISAFGVTGRISICGEPDRPYVYVFLLFSCLFYYFIFLIVVRSFFLIVFFYVLFCFSLFFCWFSLVFLVLSKLFLYFYTWAPHMFPVFLPVYMFVSPVKQSERPGSAKKHFFGGRGFCGQPPPPGPPKAPQTSPTLSKYIKSKERREHGMRPLPVNQGKC